MGTLLIYCKDCHASRPAQLLEIQLRSCSQSDGLCSGPRNRIKSVLSWLVLRLGGPEDALVERCVEYCRRSNHLRVKLLMLAYRFAVSVCELWITPIPYSAPYLFHSLVMRSMTLALPYGG